MNKVTIKLKEIRSILGEAKAQSGTPIGSTRKPKAHPAFNSLGGDGLTNRAGKQKTGNQHRSPAIYEEATKKALKKVMDKKDEVSRGKTDTGQKANAIDTEPTKPELVGYH